MFCLREGLQVTDKNRVHYIFVTDRSGSMQSICEDTEGGIRSFIGKQLEGVDANTRTVSFYQFDDKHELLYDFEPLEKAKDYTLIPRGWTALLDAAGTAITQTGEKLAAIPEDERPGYVMVIISTDGHENASKEYTRTQVRDMIKHQQDKYDWRFTYIGVGDGAFDEAASIGILRPSVLAWTGVSRDVASTYNVVAGACSAGTVPTSSGIYYSEEQRVGVV